MEEFDLKSTSKEWQNIQELAEKRAEEIKNWNKEYNRHLLSKEEIEKMAATLPEKLDKLEWIEPLNKISLSSVNEFEKASEKLDKLHSECLQANEHEKDFHQNERER